MLPLLRRVFAAPAAKAASKRAAAGTALLAAVVAGSVCPAAAGAAAGASPRARSAHDAPSAASAHRDSRHGDISKRHHRTGLPAVSHPTDLSSEPTIHRGKGRPPGALLTKDLVKGTGAVVTLSSTVVVRYVGANYRTGKVFTAQTWQSGQPATFPLSGVVTGFAQGLVGMKVGGRREIVVPPRLGYDDHATGPIKAHETLVFVVDLVSVRS